jgi:hypothetical protein
LSREVLRVADAAGGADVVVRSQIRKQLREEIASFRPVPEVMMRVDDGLTGIKVLLLTPCQPIPARGRVQ